MEGSLIEALASQLNLDIYIVLIVLLSGFVQSRFLPYRIVKWFTDKSFDAAVKTFVISMVAGSGYIYLEWAYSSGELQYGKLFISFFTATSVYELAVRPIKKYLQKKFNEKDTVDIDS